MLVERLMSIHRWYDSLPKGARWAVFSAGVVVPLALSQTAPYVARCGLVAWLFLVTASRIHYVEFYPSSRRH